MLNEKARNEKMSFNHFRKDAQKALILYNDSQAIGYMIWTENETDIIGRQIYILSSFRRGSYGTILFKKWIEIFVKDKYSNFGVESPNNAMTQLLMKEKCFGFDNAFIV